MKKYGGIIVATIAMLLMAACAEKTTEETHMPATLSYLENFISGDTEAVRIDTQSGFYITDLNMNSDEWDSYSVGDMIDLVNDGMTDSEWSIWRNVSRCLG